MSILGNMLFRLGEKGVSGVAGPLVLVVPAEVRFMMRELVVVPMGDLMLEDPEASEDIDCEVESDGYASATATGFATFSRLEKSPMFSLCVQDWLSMARSAGVIGACWRSAADLSACLVVRGVELVTQMPWGKDNAEFHGSTCDW